MSFLLSGINECVSTDDNVFLKSVYTRKEVVAALKEMGPLKAPRSDGFSAFFQRYWHIVGKDISRFCLDILNRGRDFRALNEMIIVLIPKIPSPKNVANFKPISLCDVLYKLIAKVIANRFRKVLDACIDPT